ncbi:YveK family protein [Enterococcus ratti]|uniref:Capsular polysaccharide biosynthesis protein CpsC n=1 Tax=Enterococcus ratti TaxID=150033 RepID=A0A1L8WIJ6_9ENTE|nr:Wzz/FepE/Etk N-terminal domain-containing protein [Enterococcus ratti]OJG80845.1 tyrosine-protein kinase transmembrane modulator EpsC [Enterococcus ratti]
MEELFSLSEVLQLLKKRLLLLSFIVIIGMIFAGAFSHFFIAPKFSSSTELIVQSKNERVNASLQSEVHANVLLINTYKDMILSDIVLNSTKEQLENIYSYQITKSQLANMIQVVQAPDSQMFHIKVTSENMEKSANISNAVANVFKEKVSEVLDVSKVTIVSVAQSNPVPVSPNNQINMVIGMLLGLLVGVGTVLLLEVFDKTVKDESFVSEELGFPILGVISEMNNNEVEKERMANLTTMPTKETQLFQENVLRKTKIKKEC